MARLTAADAAALERCQRSGGIVVFPSDTVYGLGCDPDDAAAAARLYELKGRAPDKPAAVMFFALAPALALFEAAGDRIAAAARALLPGAVTLLIPNPQRRFEPASGPEPETLGLRVPALPDPLAELRDVSVPLLQTSANVSGASDARRLEQVPKEILDAADLVLDGGELPGTPSTVIDLRGYDGDGAWAILREGAVAAGEVERILGR